MHTQPTTGGQAAGLEQTPNRRNVARRAAGVVAAGAAASALLEAMAGPALAAGNGTAEPDTNQFTQAVVPAVVLLADKATIAVNAALGNDFRVTLGGNRRMGKPASPMQGQQIIFQITQGPGAPHKLTWAAKYEFTADVPEPTLSTTAGQTDLVGFVYNATKGTWLCAGFVGGFD
ncbi:MAG TPA: hypothetical protein VGM53_20220 [Streptosporangiaceae bacterium]